MYWVRKLHKWTSLIVAIQILIWVISGLYFNLMDHHKAGGHSYRSQGHQAFAIDRTQLLEPGRVLLNFAPSVRVQLTNLLEQPYYLLTHQQGLYPHFENTYSLVDAYSGERAVIDGDLASKLAQASYSGPGMPDAVTLLQPPIGDFPKQQNATWRIDFDDDIDTSVYVEDVSGRIVGHSDVHKRLAGIFFMLHFMDYAGEGSFNNLQSMLFAFITLWLVLTGVIWTVNLARHGQLTPMWLKRRRRR